MTSSNDQLRQGIRELIATSSSIAPIPGDRRTKPHTKKMDRYLVNGRYGLGHEHNHKEVQHIWVRADAVDRMVLGGVECGVSIPKDDPKRTGRHSNLSQIPGFRQATLLKYTPSNMSEARLVIEAAVKGARP